MFKMIKWWWLCLILSGAMGTTYSEGGKRVYIDKSNQTLTAYEGGRAVFSSSVSTGRPGNSTPSGSFRVQGKQRMHYSRLYDNTPMPHSVQFSGHYFMHGGYVPGYPASHGCVRLPYGNAERLYNWISHGTPIIIGGHQGKGQSHKYSKRNHRMKNSFPGKKIRFHSRASNNSRSSSVNSREERYRY